ncbi:sulfite exporter TauE/SafE family protein [bacterium]|nr:sulfite exporter TauE/SafE family protein [bacterium]
MEILRYGGIAVLGVVAGLLSGLFGIGGGTVIIPALVMLLGFTQHKAQGTSLAALLLPVGLLGVIRYWKSGDVDIVAGIILAVGLFAGAYFGAGWAEKLSDIWLKRAFGIFFILLGLKYIIFP